MKQMNEVAEKHIRIIGYLTLSGGLGYLLATYVAKDPMLTAVFSPAINYVLYAIEKELKSEGIIQALKSEK